MSATATPDPTPIRLPLWTVLVCGGLIVTVSLGIRHGFGLWLQPMTQANEWPRETYAFALALQNLMWGLSQPLAGMLADRFGAFRVLVVGGVLYTLGLVLMGLSTSGIALAGTAGLMIGMAHSGTTYSVVFGVIGRNVAPERRTWAMGVAAAAGSFGQFLMLPVSQSLISSIGWQHALFALAFLVLVIVPLSFGLRESHTVMRPPGGGQTVRQAVREAFRTQGFRLLTAGYFVCGFQVVFIGIHLPSYLKDHALSPQVATTALALIGLFNILGTYLAGVLGQRLPKKHVLAGIYLLRALVIAIFVLAPLTPWSVYLFASAMGVLWLSTVPLTTGVVAHIFGVQYLSMLGGFVFLSHQVGSFLGVWLGGVLYDMTGSYTVVWWIAVALGIFAALVNLPIREQPVVRPVASAAGA